tara:strand:+ start:727 stop:1611 length:885 start_codon:yes stop_codon:yes gene_type:complete
MSKVQIQGLESQTTNSNLKVTPNGTGVLKVSGDTDGTLQLDDVKIKAPPTSAAQDYSLILPETNIAADKYLQVGGITGSGATATGQLTYATLATPSASPLDGANFTSGTVPSARYSISGSTGGGFKLINYTQATSSISQIQFTGLEANTLYRLTTKRVLVNSTYVNMTPLDSSGNEIASNPNYIYLNTLYWSFYGKAKGGANSGYGSQISTAGTQNAYSFVLDFNTGQDSTQTGRQFAYLHLYSHGYDTNTNRQAYAGFMPGYGQRRIHGMKLWPSSGNFNTNTEMLLYKFQEN